jgi:hypothetical protein
MSMEYSWKDDGGKTKALGGNFSMCHSAHHESHMVYPGIRLKLLRVYSTGSSECHCALTKGVGSDVHERLYRPERV